MITMRKMKKLIHMKIISLDLSSMRKPHKVQMRKMEMDLVSNLKTNKKEVKIII
jgi:hypothetical protein